MSQTVEILNFILGTGTVLIQIATILLIVIYFLRNQSAVLKMFTRFVGTWGLLATFLLMLGSTGMSLYYSEVLGFLPCGLCWLQRVFIYSITVILGVALIKKDKKITDYVITLSIFGILFSLYQHYLQLGGTDVIPCPATTVGDCAKRIMFEFGYVTYPLMAFSTLAFVIVVMFFVKKINKIS